MVENDLANPKINLKVTPHPYPIIFPCFCMFLLYGLGSQQHIFKPKGFCRENISGNTGLEQ
jgi:hypothetical protein